MYGQIQLSSNLSPVTGFNRSKSISHIPIRSRTLPNERVSPGKKSRGPGKVPAALLGSDQDHLRSTNVNRTARKGGLQETLIAITSTKFSLALPIPPSVNHQYATVNGRRVLSSKGRRYKTQVAQQILATLLGAPPRKELLKNLHTHALKLSIKFYFTSALRRDIDGGLKIAQDAVCEALEINDNRIVEIHLYKAIDVSYPRIECTLSTTPSRMALPKRKPGRPPKIGNTQISRVHHPKKSLGALKQYMGRKPTP